MNRLQTELHRLYGADPASATVQAGSVRALVLELARPADWAAVAALWQGVQADLGLRAPAIAVNGRDGYQLWWSLSTPVPADEAGRWLATLQAHYLPGVAADRVTLWPAAGTATTHLTPPAVPAAQPGGEHWSAFVAQDLAPIFASEPWLDIPPGDDAQADILLGLRSMDPADVRTALLRLAGTPTPSAPPATAPAAEPATTQPQLSPRVFLRQVMNDPATPLPLRIEAAKALLPYET